MIFERDLAVRLPSPRGHPEHAMDGRCFKQVFETGPDVDIRPLVIVETCAPQAAIIDLKTQWFDQVQLCATIGT